MPRTAAAFASKSTTSKPSSRTLPESSKASTTSLIATRNRQDRAWPGGMQNGRQFRETSNRLGRLNDDRQIEQYGLRHGRRRHGHLGVCGYREQQRRDRKDMTAARRPTDKRPLRHLARFI